MGDIVVEGWPRSGQAALQGALRRYGGRPTFAGDAISHCGSSRTVILGPVVGPRRAILQCRRILALAPQPVIVVVGRREHAQEIELLDAGACDVVGWSVPLEVIAARVHRHLEPIAAIPALGNIRVDAAAREALIGGIRIEASAMQVRLLALLLAASGRIVTRAEIAAALHTHSGPPSAHAIDVRLCRLRAWLAGSEASHLPTAVRGLGYRMTPVGGGVSHGKAGDEDRGDGKPPSRDDDEIGLRAHQNADAPAEAAGQGMGVDDDPGEGGDDDEDGSRDADAP